ncbi:hypothetical protein NDU88_001718 [Pleurodeles waltl]|uniref:Uncharacterized protein n=1 Tax=Pleurodeles waltl TaxID=8319 RepID=A0AAV7Q6X2_PLEWA|nr:hypothetical protein NDU88_001718 [Pleurodeles waltl]
MSQEEQVRVALALLRQAGRLDLLKEEALAPSAAAAVMACLPPRAGDACVQIRRGGKGAGGPSREGVAWEGQGQDGRRNRGDRGLRASPGVGRPRAMPQQLGLARRGKRFPDSGALSQKSGSIKKCEEGRQAQGVC